MYSSVKNFSISNWFKQPESEYSNNSKEKGSRYEQLEMESFADGVSVSISCIDRLFWTSLIMVLFQELNFHFLSLYVIVRVPKSKRSKYL